MVEPLGSYPLLVIVGPTASGKSALALALAEEFHGEIVNYDSVQLYRGFDVGSGKLSPQERRSIPHHLLDCLGPHDVFTAGDYRREAQTALESIKQNRRLPVLVGGTGLYLRALLQGLFEGPTRSELLRQRLRQIGARRGREFLHRMLRRLDRVTADRIQPRDMRKTIRALEVCLLARRPMSALLAEGRSGLGGFQFLRIGLDPDRHLLYDRINRRVIEMFRAGLLEETQRALTQGGPERVKPLGALGYSQACRVIRGESTLEQAIRETQTATRRYAKRQITWFRRESDVAWFKGFGDDPWLALQVAAWVRRSLGSDLDVAERA